MFHSWKQFQRQMSVPQNRCVVGLVVPKTRQRLKVKFVVLAKNKCHIYLFFYNWNFPLLSRTREYEENSITESGESRCCAAATPRIPACEMSPCGKNVKCLGRYLLPSERGMSIKRRWIFVPEIAVCFIICPKNVIHVFFLSFVTPHLFFMSLQLKFNSNFYFICRGESGLCWTTSRKPQTAHATTLHFIKLLSRFAIKKHKAKPFCCCVCGCKRFEFCQTVYSAAEVNSCELNVSLGKCKQNSRNACLHVGSKQKFATGGCPPKMNSKKFFARWKFWDWPMSLPPLCLSSKNYLLQRKDKTIHYCGIKYSLFFFFLSAHLYLHPCVTLTTPR